MQQREWIREGGLERMVSDGCLNSFLEKQKSWKEKFEKVF